MTEATTPTPDFPAAERHSFELKDGRSLAYYTFAFDSPPAVKPPVEPQVDNRHPILYLHGSPGCGLEGRLCARQVAKAGGKLFAIDRPGLGFSDPYPPPPPAAATPDDDMNTTTAEAADEAVWNLETCVKNFWEFVAQQGWTEFSIIGVSGGGPYTLAMLSSYLEERLQQSSASSNVVLKNVAFVAGVCTSGGVEHMMTQNQNFVELVANASTSWSSRLQLRAMTLLMSMMMNYLPASWLFKMTPTGDLPQADKEMFTDQVIMDVLLTSGQVGLRQGSYGAFQDMCIAFRQHHGFEPLLKKHFGGASSTSLPNLAVFQGEEDVNVPKAHAEYVYTELLCSKAELHMYKDLGHLSMAIAKAEDYVKFAVSK